ncbi:hypothetical protein [Limosilactobacillus oris]|uniref:hypothetical protein n=1 Tax=Limosilactobacillus oris TaxID=1632 RepID=UPI0024B9A07C|nr:hypothetical protein [Limosilactobacillus oris]
MKENKNEPLYSQTQIAKKLKISQSSVTRLLKKNGLEPLKTKGKAKLYSENQLETLNLSILQQKEKHQQNYDNNDISIFLQNEISKLHEENKRLEEQFTRQLESKDKQIDNLNERLKEAHQLQLGLEQKLKMLPDNTQKETTVVDAETVDSKDEGVKENKDTTEKKGFWKRLFGKN